MNAYERLAAQAAREAASHTRIPLRKVLYLELAKMIEGSEIKILSPRELKQKEEVKVEAEMK
jgi:hypothetical protein